jgi:hypothetical protein
MAKGKSKKPNHKELDEDDDDDVIISRKPTKSKKKKASVEPDSNLSPNKGQQLEVEAEADTEARFGHLLQPIRYVKFYSDYSITIKGISQKTGILILQQNLKNIFLN